MKRHIILIAGLIAALAMAMTAAAVASASNSAAQTSPLCMTIPSSTPANMTVVWVRLEITAANGAPIREMGLAVRRYVGANRYKDLLGVFPGCNDFKILRPANVPAKLCIYTPAGYTVAGGSCQPVFASFGGTKEVNFFVKRTS